MNWKKALGFGALIWVIMFIVISALVGYGLSDNAMFTMAVTVISLVVAYLAARNLAPGSQAKAIQYGLIFAVVGIVLDFLISQRFAPDMFSSAYYWLSYVLIVLVPLLAVKKVTGQTQPQQ